MTDAFEAIHLLQYYTVSQKKVAHCTLVHIFAKY